MKNQIVINGVAIEVEGSNVSVRGNTIFVDSQPVASGLSGQVHIYWYGDLAYLNANGRVTVHGDVHGDIEANGRVYCHEVQGACSANGRVGAAKVGGSIHANGRVNIS